VLADSAAVPWRRPFARLAVGVTTSALGDGVWLAAVPPLAATLTASPVATSLLESAAGLPWLLFGLAGGVAADRFPRRTLLWSADLLRLGVVAALAVLVAAGAATVPLLLLATFALGTAGTVADSAFPAFVPELVPASGLASANATLATGRTAGGSFVGPAAGALLFGWLVWSPLAVDAATFGVSALCLWSLRGAAPAPAAARSGMWREAAAGVRWVARHPVVRVLALATVLLALGTYAALGVLVLFARYALHVPGSCYGLLLTVYALGAIGGGVAGRAPVRRLGLCRTAPLAATGAALAWLGLAVSSAWWVAAGFLVLLGVVSTVWSVAEVTLRQTSVPAPLLGRVSSAMSLLGRGTAPLGAPLGGLVARWLGLRATVGLSALLCLLAAAILWRWLGRAAAPPPPGPAVQNVCVDVSA
jgi:MFS family permease